MPRSITPTVVYRSSQTICLPDEPHDGLIVEVVGFVQPFGTDRQEYREALGLIDEEWRFHESESLVIATRTIPTL